MEGGCTGRGDPQKGTGMKQSEAARAGVIRPQFRGSARWQDAFVRSAAPDEVVDWDAADPNLLLAAIVNWTRSGNAVTFGRTSDGGALSLTLLCGGERLKRYASSADDLAQLLEALAGAEAPQTGK